MLLNHVCLELAKKIVRDGEGGVMRVVTVRVNAATTVHKDADAGRRARGKQRALVKTSLPWRDPNWGRII